MPIAKRKEHNIFDRVLKVLARDYAASFLELALPDVPIQVIGRLENIALIIPEEQVDFIHRAMYERQEYLLHMEFQTEHRADVPERLFVYSALLTRQFGLPVLTVVIYLKRRVSPLPTAYETRVGEIRVNRFEYPVVKLWEYAGEIAAGRIPGLTPLLVMLVSDPDESTLARERELILAEKDSRKRADLLACAVTIGARYFDRQFLWRFFREEVEMLREASFIEDWLEEKLEEGLQRGIQRGIQQGIEQGLEQGIEQGLEQGLQGERQAVIAHILRHRFGEVSLNLETRLRLLATEQLTPLLDTALDAPNISAFTEEVDRVSSNRLASA
ncbi:MAG: DUF4351 domain-containing protein [Chloroflexota bacterium]|nr:DUF4351 domain-containing protein [Chloroflexota bacterium]